MLLHDMGVVLGTQRIALYDRRRRYLCEWNPLQEDISAHPRAKHIKIEFRQDQLVRARRISSLVYVNRTLSKEGRGLLDAG